VSDGDNARSPIHPLQSIFFKPYEFIELVFVEETLPDRAAARSSYRGDAAKI
jgi:hypothetical protein